MRLMSLMIFVVPFFKTIYLIVAEKASRIRESMRMMGSRETPYWLSWFVHYTMVNTLVSLTVAATLGLFVLKRSSPLVAFLYHWFYGQSLFGLILVS